MFDNLVCEYLFPNPIWCVDLNLDLKAVRDYCLDARNKKDSRTLSNRGLNSWQSSDICAQSEIVNNNELSKMLVSIEQHGNEAYKTYGPLEGQLKTTNFWININGYGAYNSIHTHPGSVLSGVFYVSVPQDADCGAINFYRNQSESFAIRSLGTGRTIADGQTPQAMIERWYEPIENRLFLFPSWMPHDVGVNTSDKERISISFNLTN